MEISSYNHNSSEQAYQILVAKDVSHAILMFSLKTRKASFVHKIVVFGISKNTKSRNFECNT
jgi:hypothetical protein